MQQICRGCERVIRQDDEIIAHVVARYHELGSSKVYSITKPTECLDIYHKNCNYPQGEPEGD
jgi:hypothetical protein